MSSKSNAGVVVGVVLLSTLVVNQHSATLSQTESRIFSERIVGGEQASILSHPYQVSIQYFGFHYCGAAVISDRFIVTAAHCAIG